MKTVLLTFNLLVIVSVVSFNACTPDDTMKSDICYPLVLEETINGYSTEDRKEFNIDLDESTDFAIHSSYYAQSGVTSKYILIETPADFKIKTQDYVIYLCEDTLWTFNELEDTDGEYYKRYECDWSNKVIDTLHYKAAAFFQEEDLALNLVNTLPADSGEITLYHYIEEYWLGDFGPPQHHTILNKFTKSVFKENEEGFILLEHKNGQLLKMKIKYLPELTLFLDYVEEL